MISLDPAFLSFDAYTGIREFLLFMEDIVAYLERGGVVAWGLVPAQVQEFRAVTQAELYRRFFEIREQVTEFCPPDLFFRQSIITPTCGIQAGDTVVSVEIMRAAAALSERIREEWSG